MQLQIDKLRLLDGPKADNGKAMYGGRIAARKYVRPEKIGSILLSPAWTVDNSRSLWEPIAYSPSAVESLLNAIGIESRPEEGVLPYREAIETKQAIFVTAPHRGVCLPEVEGEGEVYLLWVTDVVKVHPFAEDQADE